MSSSRLDVTDSSAAPATAASWVEVLVDSPGATGLYTYRVPDALAVSQGDIVSVPFGRQQVGAITVRPISKAPSGLPPASIKSVESVVGNAYFTKEYWRLLNRVTRYYQTPFIRVIRTALPPGLLAKSQRRIRLREPLPNPRPIEAVTPAEDFAGLSEMAVQLMSLLGKSPQGDYSWQYLQRQLAQTSQLPVASRHFNAALQQLVKLGWAESYWTIPRSPQSRKRQAVALVRSAASSTARGDAAALESLSARQREIVIAIERLGGELWLSDALQRLRTTSKTLHRIAALGYLAIEPREVLRASSHSAALPDRPKRLTPAQSRALAAIAQMRGYSEALLHGVTGSGKTEVYLQAIAPVLAAGKSALVLVPEIGLTPQLTDRFRSRFGQQVCVYHSGLSEGERYDTWRQMLAGTPQIIIGTRSAVFAPLPNLGMLILDEEHDSSFKQDRPMPCYHARQVARWRAELENCPLILGSATPSLETWTRFKNARDRAHNGSPRLRYLSLPERVRARPLPPVEIVDMRQELHAGNRTIFSRRLQQALEDLVAKGERGILFIHRRGHSSFVSCRSCGHVMECPHCDVSLSFHQPHREAAARLRCHYCGYSQSQPPHCPACASPYLKNFGSGTQRVVNDLAKYLPQARCIRFDSDTTRNKGAHRALLDRFARGEADLLVGTQMLTKGIDLPQVTLVGVIAADGLLFMPDFRASERAFQTLTQVAGRAGRGDRPGRVIVQTYSPEHAVIQALETAAGVGPEGELVARGDLAGSDLARYEAFLQQELGDRAALGYPPYGQLILLRLSGLSAIASERAARQLAALLQEMLDDLTPGLTLGQNLSDCLAESAVTGSILGPVPAPIYRVARRYRWHILLKLPVGAALPDLSHLGRHCPKEVALAIDVNPLNLS